MVQIITGCILIIFGAYVFTKYPIKKDTKSLVLGALIVVITLVLKRLSIMIPLFGVPALKIGFEMLPMMIAGMILSPSYGFIVGVAVDFVGLIIVPTGFPFLGFTLNSVLMSCAPAMILEKTKMMDKKRLEKIVTSVIIIMISFVIMYILLLDSVVISGTTVQMPWIFKTSIIFVCIVLGIVLWLVSRYMKRKVTHDNVQMFYIWILAVIITEIGVTFLLTPYWLQVMYGIPFFVSLFVRVIKQCIMIPFDIVVGYQLLKVLKKI